MEEKRNFIVIYLCKQRSFFSIRRWKSKLRTSNLVTQGFIKPKDERERNLLKRNNIHFTFEKSFGFYSFFRHYRSNCRSTISRRLVPTTKNVIYCYILTLSIFSNLYYFYIIRHMDEIK